MGLRKEAVSGTVESPEVSRHLGFGVLIALALTVPVTGRPQHAAFTSAVDLVRLPVVVLDKAGVPVRGLSAGDFEVFENGQRQTVTSFAAGAPGDDLPLHLGLMLDKSGSMEADLRVAANAAVTFVNTLDEARDVTFVDFDAGIRVGRFQPSNYPYLFERIRDPRIGQGTALYDAVARYLDDTELRAGQHVLVLYSDGGDSRSALTLNQLIGRLRIGHVIVYAIGYMENQLVAGRLQQEATLVRIARETGGDAYFPTSPGDVSRIYARIQAEIEGRYTVGYVPTDPRSDGRFRKVEVRVTRPDLKGGKVRTRVGYLRDRVS